MTDFSKIVQKPEEIEKFKKEDDFYDFTDVIFYCEIEFSKVLEENTFYNVSFKNAVFKEEVCFKYLKFLGNVDFRKAQFKRNANFSVSRFLENVTFRGSKFELGAYFGGAIFFGTADFSLTDYSENTCFQNAIFRNKVFFQHAKFVKKTDFGIVRFFDDVNFFEAEFAKPVNFRNTVFGEKCNFRSAKFAEEADFEKAKFRNNVDFLAASFSGEAIFGRALFFKDSDFRRSKFHSLAIFSNAIFLSDSLFGGAHFSDETDFEKTQFCGYADFYVAEFAAFTDFKEALFGEKGKSRFVLTKFLDVANFFGAQFLGKKNDFSGVLFAKNFLFKEAKLENGNRETFRIIKHGFLTDNNRIDALAFHKKEMRAYWKDLFEEDVWSRITAENFVCKLKKWLIIKICQQFNEKIILFLSRYSNNYGLSWWRSFGTTIAISLVFFVLYILTLSEPYFTLVWHGGSNFSNALDISLKYWVQFLNPAHSFLSITTHT